MKTDTGPSYQHDLPDMEDSVGHVLAVDDEAMTLMLIRKTLESRGHTVTCLQDASQVLGTIEKSPPDVIILDVMMPRMNGISACRQIKDSPLGAHIPVLIVTSLAERQDRIAGIAAGASDFLQKPIDLEDLSLRIRNAVRMKRLRDLVCESYEKLQHLEEMRDTLAHMIVHDIRSALSAIQWGLNLLLKKREPPMAPELVTSQLQNLRGSTDELLELTSSVLDVSRMEEGKMPVSPEQVDMVALAGEAVASLGVAVDYTPVSVECAQESLTVACDPELIRRVLLNMLYNAMRHSPTDGSITIGIATDSDNGTARVSVADEGPGIAKELQSMIFEKYGQVKTKNSETASSHSTGLGLSFCKLAVEAHGGAIGVDSELGHGSTFWFTLPVA